MAGPFTAEIATTGSRADPAHATVLGFGAYYECGLAANATTFMHKIAALN